MGERERLNELSVRELAERLATSEPVPGGGSAAAVTGALAAALVNMVAELTVGRDEYADVETEVREIALAAAGARGELLELAELDAAAYRAVVSARRLARDGERERALRATQIAGAMREATLVPLRTAQQAARVLELAERIAAIGNRNAASDAGAAAALAAAAVRAAAMNVHINLPYLDDGDDVRREAATVINDLEAGLPAAEERALRATHARMGVATSR